MRFLLFFLAIGALWPPMSLAQTTQAPLARADIAFQMAQTVQNSAAAQAVQQIALRLALKEDGLEDLALDRRDLNEQITAVRTDGTLSAAARRQRLEELDTALLVNSRALAAEFPGYLDIVAPDPVTIDEVQALIDPDEALIQFHQGSQWLSIWMVAREHVTWHRVPMTEAEAADFVRRYREGMGLDGTLRAAAALAGSEEDEPRAVFDVDLSITLYQWLFAPYAEDMANYPHLLIVPDKAWIGLPFATLLTDSEISGADPTLGDLRRANWMMREHAITTMPSAVGLRASVSSAAAEPLNDGRSTLLAVGDPVFTGAAMPEGVLRAAASGAVDVSALVPLPGTRREVNAIAAEFGAGRAEVLLGPDASEARVRMAELSQTDIIVFATHGLIAGELQGLAEPALALTPPAGDAADRLPDNDGLLTAGEIAGLTLSADWVVLSACNTAAGNGEGAEGLSGLARAFFAAGAEALLVSHWPVRDDAAARLTATAFAEIEAEPTMRKSEAMRRAMIALMDDPSDDTLAHPASWAPFFVVGNE